ncbi:hypothetical protein U0070_014863 [Myodes glareolus]|uniref:G-protein coupled receptors family 1 profile domain-containing protein n=1 Tax=Myodes glareolus TaxID=447135 RepID=A0AAW0IE85_MYOGA
MSENNYSVTTEFILVGFSDHPILKILLFMVFSVIYLVTIVGNLGLVLLIYMEHRLHTPMYIFLGNLALMDFCCSCAITPKMLQNFFSVDRKMSLYECMVQFSFLCLAETTDSFLLAAMAYDRYVAICNPLQYHTMMSMKLCLQMTIGAYIAGILHPMIEIVGGILALATAHLFLQMLSNGTSGTGPKSSQGAMPCGTSKFLSPPSRSIKVSIQTD